MKKKIYCTGCGEVRNARLTTGKEIYPRSPSLSRLPFYKCDSCGAYVGCHHKHHDKTKRLNPKGSLASPPVRLARMVLHSLIDPLWQGTGAKRSQVYKAISRELGYEFHVGEVKTVDEAQLVERVVRQLFCLTNA